MGMSAVHCQGNVREFHGVWRVVTVCRARGLNREDAMHRSRWRKQIGMIDDHDECELVNVSSGTGSPELSRTKSTELMVVAGVAGGIFR